MVTGSRVATAPEDLAANVTVLSRADFDVEKPVKLADILRRVAGVHVDQVGGRGGTGSLYLRGADPNYTLVLVDGVRVNDPTNARGATPRKPAARGCAPEARLRRRVDLDRRSRERRRCRRPR
ncbi:MAG TPA: TonB-dependent receptor plug domain-containing protein, partial [Steroidobacteraceae bacterium]|nr:TonB-dependent receptor plug domain-containing protein [Steroidobacteraceae bacterium]